MRCLDSFGSSVQTTPGFLNCQLVFINPAAAFQLCPASFSISTSSHLFLPSAPSAEKVGQVEVMADFTYQPELLTAAHTIRDPGDAIVYTRTNTHRDNIHLYPTKTKQEL